MKSTSDYPFVAYYRYLALAGQGCQQDFGGEPFLDAAGDSGYFWHSVLPRLGPILASEPQVVTQDHIYEIACSPHPSLYPHGRRERLRSRRQRRGRAAADG